MRERIYIYIYTERGRNGQRHIDSHAERQTDRQTGRRTDGHIDRQKGMGFSAKKGNHNGMDWEG